MTLCVDITKKISPQDWEALRQQGNPLWLKMIDNSCVIVGKSGDSADRFNDGFPKNVDDIVIGKWAFIKNTNEVEPRFYFELKNDLLTFKLTFHQSR